MKNMTKWVKVNRSTERVQVEWFYLDSLNGWTGISRVVREMPVPAWGDPVTLGNKLLDFAIDGEVHAPGWGFELNEEDKDLLKAFGY